MLAILLFLPLFFFGNMIIDSVVGEKERKTGEILMAMPIPPSQIILGKILAVEGVNSCTNSILDNNSLYNGI